MMLAGVKDRDIRLLDRWLRYRAKLGQLTLEHILEFAEGKEPLTILAQLLTAIDPGNLDTAIIQQARTRKCSRAVARSKAPPYGSLPEPFLSEIKRISVLEDLSDSTIANMAKSLRRLLVSADKRGLEPKLTMETTKAFVQDLRRDPIKNISKASYCMSLGQFATHAEYPEEIATALAKKRSELAYLAKGEVPRKEIKLAKNPIDLVDLAKTASDIFDKAPDQEQLVTRRRDYTLAGAMAFLCKLQIRVKDLLEGKIGKEFCRDSEGWLADLETSKTDTKIKGRLPDCLTPYLDAVLLMDTDSQYLWQIYDRRCYTALFANPAREFRSYSHTWLYDNLIQHTGHSAHIVRTLIYDHCAMDEKLDRTVAQALTGHASATSSEFYEINADRYRMQHAQNDLKAIEKSLNI